MLDPKFEELLGNISSSLDKLDWIERGIVRTHKIIYTPGMCVSDVEKASAKDPGSFKPGVKYPVVQLHTNEIDLLAEGINPDVASKGFDLIAFVIDQRGKLIPTNLHNCKVHVNWGDAE